MRTVHRTTLTSIRRWLALGRDVTITGDVGSGKSVVAEALFEDLRGQGWSGVILRGSRAAQRIPLAPFAGHPSLEPATAGGRWTLDSATQALRAETAGRPAVVVVDDLHALDDVSLAAIGVLAGSPRRHVRLVATLPAGPKLCAPASSFLRESATVTVRPLDVAGLTDLLVDLLAAPADAHLVTAISALSQGNPRACRVLVSAGMHARLLRKVRGQWGLEGSLDTVTDGLPAALLADLDDHLVGALETVAAFGMPESGDAHRLVGADAVESLMALGRLRSYRREGETLVLVSPPGLAIALRRRLSAERRGELGRRALALSTEGRGPHDAAPLVAVTHRHAPAETAGLLAESLTVRRSMARARWESEPSVTHALPLLRRHLFNDSDPSACREIFARTAPGPEDGHRPSVTYAILAGLWTVLHGGVFSEGVLRGQSRPAELGSATASGDVLAALDRRYAGERLVDLAGTFDPAAVPWPLSSFATVLQAQIDLEIGRPERALEVLGPRHRQPSVAAVEDTSAIDAIGDTVRTDALLLAGRIDDAVQFARFCMAEAYDRLNELAIRMSARSSASALFVSGDHDGALQAIDVALHLVRGNPLTAPYDDRVLGLGAVLYARRGDDTVARSLLDRLESSPRSFDPGLDLMLPWARLEVEAPRARGSDTHAQALWDHGADLLARGQTTAAALAWAATPMVLDDAQLAAYEAVDRSIDVPLLAPAVALHREISRGTADGILAAAARQPVQGPLLRVAGDRARDRAIQEGLPPLTDDEIRRRCGPVAEAMLACRPAQEAQPLTEREQEVALLAREGLSNRQIAARVYLSVRTVENHLYRALRKIGVSDRSELVGWQPST